PGVPLAARIYDRAYLGYRPGLRRQIRDFGGYEDDPLGLRRYAGMLEDAREQPRLLAHANVRYLFERPADALPRRGSDRRAMTLLDSGVWELHRFAPAVMWADTATVVDGGPAHARAALRELDGGEAVVLEAPTLTAAQRARAADGDPGAATVAGELVELS